MPQLNYHHLYLFWLVAREGGVTKAAERAHLTQPTISAQLKLLERDLGARLFTRRGRTLALTDVGGIVFRYAEEIFALGREMEVALERGAAAGKPLRFAVGVVDTLPRLTTYRLLAPAFELGQPVRVLARTDRLDRLLADLSTHALDLVLSDTPAPSGLGVRVFTHLLGECDVTIFAAPALAATLRAGFPRSLDGAPLLMPGEHSALRRSLDGWLAAERVRPEVVAEVDDPAILQVFGQHGMGVFPAPSVVEDEVRRSYGVESLGRLPGVRERFYAVSAERRLTHAAVVAVTETARGTLLKA